jgi:hypothetical protein
MLKKTYLKSILSYFTSMDIANLRLHLKDEYNYEDTTKEIFLNEIEKIFDAHKNSGDTELIIYNGACAGKRCENCGKKGYRFVGNHSKNYMDLLFEIEGDDIKDIFSCSYFNTEVEIEGLQTKADIYFNEDDRISFKRTPDYWFKVYSASAAYKEIITKPPRRINFEELSNWLDKHSVTDELIGSDDIFKPQMRWTPFSMLYDELKKIRDYSSRYMHNIVLANSSKSLLKSEQELIDWIFANEALYEAAPFDLTFSFEKEGDGFIFNRRDQFILFEEEFDQTFGFILFYKENYEILLQKYNTYTAEEERELYNKRGFGKDSADIFSLKFHLENRKALEVLGINIPLYINQEIMPF